MVLLSHRKPASTRTCLDSFCAQGYYKITPCTFITHFTHTHWFYSYSKSQQDALFLKFILVKNSTHFGQIYCPSSALSILYTQQQVFVMLVMFTSLTVCQHNLYDKYLLLYIPCWDSWRWTVDLSETCRVLYQNKFEKQCISLAFIIRIYHAARFLSMSNINRLSVNCTWTVPRELTARHLTFFWHGLEEIK